MCLQRFSEDLTLILSSSSCHLKFLHLKFKEIIHKKFSVPQISHLEICW